MDNTIRVLRAIKKVSQQEVADALDVTVQTINAIENNRYGPSYLLGARIADYFGVHPHQVFILDAEDRKKKEPK